MTIVAETMATGRQAGRHGVAVGAKSLILNVKAGGRKRDNWNILGIFKTRSSPSPISAQT